MVRQGLHTLNGWWLRSRGIIAALLAVSGTLGAQRQAAAPRLDKQLAPLRVIDATMIDTTARACGDFFQFANGAWLARDTIPAAYSS
jgi:putative endopeptidase